MMIEENGDMDLGLALCYPNQSNSGAGVNAGSSIDMAFVASDPLSELVWSPQRGLSLKCANCSLTEKKTSCPGDVGPSNMVLTPTHSIRSRGSNDDKPISERKLKASGSEFHGDNEAVKDSYSVKSPRSSVGALFGSSPAQRSGVGGNMEEMNPVEVESVVHFNQMQECNMEEKALLVSLKGNQFQEFAGTSNTDAGHESQRTTDFLLLLNNESKCDLKSGKINGEEIISSSGKFEDVSGSQMMGLEITLASEAHIIKQPGFLDDPMSNSSLQRRTRGKSAIVIEEGRNDDAHGPDPLMERQEFSADNDIQHLIGKDLLRGKGKEKALFGIDVSKRISKDEDDSQESVESCNSASLFSKGKKRRWSFEQKLLDGSKRIKRQFQETSSSTSLIKQDSSFMNWISNMVKGLAKSNQDEFESYDRKNNTHNKAPDCRNGKVGFQSIFQSLYCPNTKLSETRMLNVDYPVSSAKELLEAEKECINIMPISFCRENTESCKQFIVENNNSNHSASGNGGGVSTQPSSLPQILSSNNASTQETCKTNSSENKILSSLACIKEKYGVIASDNFLDKQKFLSAENNSLYSQSEEKAILDIDKNNDPLRSSWITRFSSKKHVILDSPVHQKNTEARENSGEDPVNAVAMASVFARRLDALKGIIPSDAKDDTALVRRICLFCGKSGHDLCNCSEVNKAELEGLLRCIKSRDVAEESPCFCIKCFQLDHWAITCPISSVSRQQQLDKSSGFQIHMSSYKDVELKENKMAPFCSSTSKHVWDAENLFDAIRRLHLSRMDILKWMNSNMPVSRLNGFFLRLRLGNWEKGLCGTGYYVACIDETRREKISKGSKSSIYVGVRGIRCLVESQYVSNQDFSEDELMAWWNTTSKNGKVPTEDDFRSKIEERKKLGF